MLFRFHKIHLGYESDGKGDLEKKFMYNYCFSQKPQDSSLRESLLHVVYIGRE